MSLRSAMLATAFFLAAASVTAKEPVTPQKVVRDLIARKRAPEAIELLKKEIKRNPQSKPLRLLLAEGYLADENEYWAVRTLRTVQAMDPADCEPALTIAWITFKQGNPDAAETLLKEANCAQKSASDARKSLLLAKIAAFRDDDRATKQALAGAVRARRMYRDDIPALYSMVKTHDPGYIDPLVLGADWMLGWTSNAMAGSPTDPAASEEVRSLYTELNAKIRFTAPTGRWIRPFAEGDARIKGFVDEEAQEESTVRLNARPGVLIGNDSPRLKIAYGFDALSLLGGDRYKSSAIWFYNAHRIELEVQLPANLLFFGGGGRRTFREMGRSRTEMDGGIGAHISALPSVLNFLGAFTFRAYNAENNAYDLRGLTALLSSELKIKKRWSARLGLLASVDNYPLSKGYFDSDAPNRKRKDTLLKVSLSGYTPVFFGLKAGLTYEFSKKWSTAEPYEYKDHRIMLKLSYSFSTNPFFPKKEKNKAHVLLFNEKRDSAVEERVQDLIRQEEAAQRSSSCVD